MIFKGKRNAKFHNFTMDVDPGCKNKVKLRGGVQWCMMQSQDFNSSIGLRIKNENNELVSFGGQSITFRLSIKQS